MSQLETDFQVQGSPLIPGIVLYPDPALEVSLFSLEWGAGSKGPLSSGSSPNFMLSND